MKGVPVLVFSLVLNQVIGQGVSSIVDNSTNPGEVLMEFDDRSIDIIGSYYLFNDWEKGDLTLNSGVAINEQWLNYDVEYDLVEVRLADEVKIVPLSMLKEFRIFKPDQDNMIFKPCDKYFHEKEIPMVGICEVLDSNYYGLIIQFNTDVKESTYIPALDMGNMEDELIVTKELYLSMGDKVVVLPKKRQSFNQLYSDRTDLESFIKEQKLNYKNKHDLKIILDFLNEDQNLQ